MGKLRVCNFAMSADGYAAGPDQSVDNPMGVGGNRLHEWVFATRTGQQMIGQGSGGSTGVDDDFIAAGFTGIGATVMGRNMFGPIRGSWDTPGAEAWTGWWGPEPPFHHPVFVLTHHARPPVEMAGGTTFHFVTDGIEAALARAVEVAGDQDVRLGGGVATVQDYLRAGLVDDLHIVVVPVLLGRGERLFDHLEGSPKWGPDQYECVEFVTSPAVAHLRFAPTA
jgi:dihydrofolate reductase